MALGSARKPHVLRVRCGFCALSETKLAAPITPTGTGSYIVLTDGMGRLDAAPDGEQATHRTGQIHQG
ncbi:hypothetical protein CF117_12370 [Aeromonas veronii]|nr:hypothetical protein CF117_12370 [Aeromonas veronii]